MIPQADAGSIVTQPRTSVSVIIPVYNARLLLKAALEALGSSSIPPHEILVVDDGSTDGSGALAATHGATVVGTGKRSGPARARNLAAQAATGDILLFLDADVCVYPDTVETVTGAFANPGLDALIGSYDDDPSSPDFLSQYKNLMHHYAHQNARSEACTFWSGCGAMRRNVFLEFSGFDERYGRPAIEDIELGHRLSRSGRRIVLDRNLHVKHLKRWSFWGLVKTDILDRGIPWTELILRDQRIANDLNLQLSQRVSVALVYLTLGIATLCAIYWRGYFLTPLFALLFLLLGRYWVDGAPTRPRAVTAVMGATSLAIVGLSWWHHMLGLIPLILLSVPALLLRHRYEWDDTRSRLWMRVGFGAYFAVSVGAVLTYLPGRPLIVAFAIALLAIVVLNRQFYVFLAGKRGGGFAIAAVPFHLLYHFYNGLSFGIGVCRWGWRELTTARNSNTASDHGKS